MDARAEKIALFRHALIAPLLLEILPRGELTRRAEEIAARKYEIPYSERTSISVDTLLDWVVRYRRDGFPALAPKQRRDSGQSRVVPPQLAALIERLRRENPHRTGRTLLRELALVSGTDSPGISAATLYRFLKQQGLTTRLLVAAPAHTKFEAERSNQIWQSDMLFGPHVQRAGGGRMQAFLFAVLDDASRLIPHAQFYAHQGPDAFIDCLRQGVAARGVCIRLYVDDAKVYRSSQLARITASIGILIIHSPPHQAQVSSKIERFLRTLREQFLADLDPQQTLSLEELNRRLWVWIEQVYHRSEHGSLGTTPLLRWQRDIEHVRKLPPSTDLRSLFFCRLNRVVRRDLTFKLRGQFYKAPSSLEGKTIEVRFDPLDLSQVEIYFQGEAQTMERPIDTAINAQLPSLKPVPDPPPPPTGISFVEFIEQKHQQAEPEKEHDKDKEPENKE
jgi:putative transposase